MDSFPSKQPSTCSKWNLDHFGIRKRWNYCKKSCKMAWKNCPKPKWLEPKENLNPKVSIFGNLAIFGHFSTCILGAFWTFLCHFWSILAIWTIFGNFLAIFLFLDTVTQTYAVCGHFLLFEGLKLRFWLILSFKHCPNVNLMTFWSKSDLQNSPKLIIDIDCLRFRL